MPIAAYERRPSCWSSSMIDLETSSSTTPGPVGERTRCGRCGCSPADRGTPGRVPVKDLRTGVDEGFRCRNVSVPLNPLFIGGWL